jgi:SAM-dependent methyltransferase
VSRARLDEHRRLWRDKPVLEGVYRVWFDTLLAAMPRAARVLEVGAGPGFLAAHARAERPDLRWIATDVIETPWNDLVADGLRLPLAAASVEAVVGLDLVHHLARPAAFFAEAARVLVPGGRVAVVEPWVTPFSYPIYRFLHQEGCTLSLDPWNPFGLAEGDTKDAFDGDAAVAHRLLGRTPHARWAELGFLPPRCRRLNGFAYLLSLGFKPGSLLPRPVLPWLVAADRATQPLAGLLGMRAVVVWDRLS